MNSWTRGAVFGPGCLKCLPHMDGFRASDRSKAKGKWNGGSSSRNMENTAPNSGYIPENTNTCNALPVVSCANDCYCWLSIPSSLLGDRLATCFVRKAEVNSCCFWGGSKITGVWRVRIVNRDLDQL